MLVPADYDHKHEAAKQPQPKAGKPPGRPKAKAAEIKADHARCKMLQSRFGQLDVDCLERRQALPAQPEQRKGQQPSRDTCSWLEGEQSDKRDEPQQPPAPTHRPGISENELKKV